MTEVNTVYLSGGPFEQAVPWPAPPSGDTTVKVPRANGYEHFEDTGERIEVNGKSFPVYRWCHRTFIAE